MISEADVTCLENYYDWLNNQGRRLFSEQNLLQALTSFLSFYKRYEQASKELPKKKEKIFDNEPYCKSCRLSETFCQCDGFNEGVEASRLAFMKQQEIIGRINAVRIENTIKKYSVSHPYYKDVVVEGDFGIIACTIEKDLKGEG